MRSRRRVHAAAWVLPLCSTSSLAAPPVAPAPEEPIVLEYRPAPGCPPEQSLISSLRASTTRFRFARDDERARSFSIDTDTEDESASQLGPTVAPRYVGRLTIREPSGDAAVREVTGDACAEVVAALAFIAALAIDPSATPAPASPAHQDGDVAIAAGPGVSAAPGSTAPAVAPPTEPSRPYPDIVGSERGTPQQSRRRSVSRLSVAVRGGVLTGVAPGFTAFGRLSGEVSRLFDGSPWSPALGVSVARGASRERTTAAGAATLTWTTGRLDSCALRLPTVLDSVWGVWLCPFVEAGALAGNAETPQTRAWGAAGALGRFALALSGPISFEVETGLGAPFKRYHFFFAPNTEVYRVPLLSFSAGAGVVARLW